MAIILNAYSHASTTLHLSGAIFYMCKLPITIICCKATNTCQWVLLITGLDYWTGPLDWTHIFLVFTLSEVIFCYVSENQRTSGSLLPIVNHEYEDYRKKNTIWVVIVRSFVALMLVFCLFQTICSYFLSKKLYCYSAHVYVSAI